MSALGVIKEADACGVRVSLNGDSLALKASAKRLLCSGTSKHKAEIVALLRKECAPPDPGEVEERKAMAMDSVPELYLDGWARLQLAASLALRSIIVEQCSRVPLKGHTPLFTIAGDNQRFASTSPCTIAAQSRRCRSAHRRYTCKPPIGVWVRRVDDRAGSRRWARRHRYFRPPSAVHSGGVTELRPAPPP
jgi:hypothetical protein